MQDSANNIGRVTETLAYHRQHPEISLKSHFRNKILKTADRVLARKAIYLDTRYWITLRDVRLGRARTPVDKELLETLTHLVKAGKGICPINANILAELLKQRDANTRLATAKVVEELSLGVALQSEEERIGTELMHCARLSIYGPDSLEPLKRLVWTSVSYVLGYVFPTLDSLSTSEELAVQKAFTDYLWDVRFSDQISTLGAIPEQLIHPWERIAEKLNKETRNHGGTPRSFKEAHLQEFVGYLEGFLSTMGRILLDVTLHASGPTPPQNWDCEKEGRDLLRILTEAFRRNKLGTQLPSVVIKCALYAAVRLDRGRQYTANDLHDFGHATAALAYFDYFATENALKHLITNQLKYDRKYSVIVVSQPSEFLQLLKQI